MWPRSLLSAFLLLSFFSCSSKKEPEQKINVFCAASVAPVIEKVKLLWEQENESRIIINAASSGLLARQIEYGAPGDMFISANEMWMQYLVKNMKLDSKVHTIATNQLVIAVPVSSQLDTLPIDHIPATLEENGKRLVIGDPAHVPLGKYTQECLEFYKIYDPQKSNYIVSKDARNALRLLELGEATFGILYYSDAVSSDHVKIISIIPDSSHQLINYSAIVLNNKDSASAQFLDFLTSKASQQVWEEYGFSR